MSSFPVVVSFYTKDTPYEEEVKNLISSCEKWGLVYSIEGIPSLGSWEKNCAYKPAFLIKKLEELKCPLLWVDADAIFVRPPDGAVFQEMDFGVRVNEEFEPDHSSRVLSGTVYVNNTEGAKKILQLWAEESQLLFHEEGAKVWDQIALRKVLQLKKIVAIVGSLPTSYVKIFDNFVDDFVAKEPVIEHYQASRRFRDVINRSPRD